MSENTEEYNKAKDELSQKSRTYGYESLTDEEKIQSEWDIEEEVLEQISEENYNKIKNTKKNVIIEEFESERINDKKTKSLKRKVVIEENVDNNNYLDIIKTSIENLKSYQLYKKIYYFVYIFLSIWVFGVVLLITLLIMLGEITDIWGIILPYSISFIIVIGMYLSYIYIKSHPKYFAMILVGERRVYSYFTSKSHHIFSDGYFYFSSHKNRTYRLGKRSYRKYISNMDIHSTFEENKCKVNVFKNGFCIKNNDDKNNIKSKLILDENYNIETLKTTKVIHDYEGTSWHTDVFSVTTNLLNNKFYLPKALKSKLEKENVEYLNDSRIVFVDDIYKVIKEARKSKKYG